MLLCGYVLGKTCHRFSFCIRHDLGWGGVLRLDALRLAGQGADDEGEGDLKPQV